MEENFSVSLQAILQYEGGFVNHPQDPGGATNKGITLTTFREAMKNQRLGVEDLKKITVSQVEKIYKASYWSKCRCDELPSGVDLVVFDQAVNSGVKRSVQWLQTIVKVPADGVIGPYTLEAVPRMATADIINQLCDLRLSFLRYVRNGSLWLTFGRGWQARVDDVRERALKLHALNLSEEQGDA